MGLKLKFNLLNLANFTVQLKFLVTVIEAVIVTTGAFALEDGFLSYFIVNCLAFSVTGLLFIASAFDLLKTQEDMRQFVSRIYIFTHFEKKCVGYYLFICKYDARFHKAVAVLLIFSGFIGIIFPSYRWGENFRICAYILGFVLAAPLNFLISWQSAGYHSTEQLRRSGTNFYCYCGCRDDPGDHDLDEVLTPAPPRYSESGFPSRGKYNDSGPIVPLPASHSVGANQFV
ncbi:hypothetical protein Fcan01_16893 [Folsomia candida]|uniref:Uncharacterized protein n=1 Tax=Folsomia candida TaxID=158441 RepID=A0A226DRA6_FOLCA|nr:hypothetical protein Fcan01_16893 [Folsomia candida]